MGNAKTCRPCIPVLRVIAKARLPVHLTSSNTKLSPAQLSSPTATTSAVAAVEDCKMVLEDVNNPPDSFSDNPYPSDNDAYTSPPPGTRYDASDLPRPIAIFGPLLGFSSSAVRHKTSETLRFAESKIHRPLSNEESLALARHLYKLEQTKSYFAVTGAAAGVYRWYSTFESGRYPFYKPKPESIDPNKFLFVKGPMAQYARQSWRFTCYFYAASELGKLVAQIVAQPAAAQATSNDTALTQFTKDLKQAMMSDHARGAGNKNSVEERRASWEAAAKARASENSASSASSASGARSSFSDDDDMSPTAGNESWQSSSTGSWGDPQFSSDSQSQAPQPQQSFGGSYAQQQQSRQSRPSDDDASPTGGMFQDDVQNAQSRPGESAWDRLRRGQAPTPPQGPPPSIRRGPPQQQKPDTSMSEDSFSSGSANERNQERERAQREFDARIEMERQGQDFNEERKW